MIFSQRDLSWDFVKFVLMFFILYGHFCPAGEEWTPVTRIIGLYVIPGFFFVSGYFQTQVRNFSSLIEKMKRLLMRIVLPMLSWGSIYVFISLLQSLYRGDITDAIDVYQFFKYSPFYVMGFYWFFTAMLFCVILGTLLSWIRGKNTYLYLFLLFASPFFFCVAILCGWDVL